MSDRLYFRQLLSGRDFAAGDIIAQQMRNFLPHRRPPGDRRGGDGRPGVCRGRSAGHSRVRWHDPLGVLVTHHHPDHVGGSMMGFTLKGLAELLERVSPGARQHPMRPNGSHGSPGSDE